MQINKALSYPIKDRIITGAPALDAEGKQIYRKTPVLDADGNPETELVVVDGVIQKQVKLVDTPVTRDVIEPYIDTEADADGVNFHVELDDGSVLDFHIGRTVFEAVSTLEERQAIIDAEIATLSAKTAPADSGKWTDGIL